MGRHPFALCAAAGVVAALAGGCSDESPVYPIESTRVVLDDGPTARATSAQRFGVPRGMGGMAGMGGAPTTPDAAATLAWAVPAGWRQLAAEPPRTASFSAPGGVDVSLTTLPGAAGGLVANVNRWRGQMGLPELARAAVEDLPRRPLLDGEAVRVDLTGSYSGMGDQAAAGTWRMLGLILSDDARTVFLKLVGPADAVDAQVAAFDTLADSLHVDPHAGHDHAAQPHSAAPDDEGDPHAGLDPHAAASDPHAGLGLGAQGGGRDPLGLSWTAPDGWHPGPPRSMRVVTLVPDVAPEVECYAVVLGGDGGGVLQNLNLWRAQLGRPPWDAAQLASAESLRVLGRDAVLVSVEGAGETAELALRGVICPLEEHTLFVKLVGPRADVAEASDAFEAFCRSLER